MTSRLSRACRTAIAIGCMALSFMLSSQTALAVAHQIEHAHHHAHDHALLPDPLLGNVIYLSDQEHSAGKSAPNPETSGASGDQRPGLGHDHGAGPINHQHDSSLIVFLISQNFVLVNCDVPKPRCEFVPESSVTFSPSGPDHPPKRNLEIRV